MPVDWVGAESVCVSKRDDPQLSLAQIYQSDWDGVCFGGAKRVRPKEGKSQLEKDKDKGG